MPCRRTIARSILLTLCLASAVTFISSQRVRGIEIARTGALVSTAPLPDMAGSSCTWEVAAPAERPVRAAFQTRQAGAGSSASPSTPFTVVTWNDAGDPISYPTDTPNKPIRFVQDPYPSFGVVKVDAARNEVVLADGNRFNIMVYDRLANTPAGASHVQPKRIIGGLKTDSQFPSDAYIDPRNGDIYVPNNDSTEGLNVFSREQRGNVEPARNLTAMPYGSFGIAVDEERQEMLITVQHDGAVVAWKKGASGNDLPVRLIQGDRTGLGDPHGIALDAKNRLLFVTNFGTSHLSQMGKTGPNPRAKPGAQRPQFWPAGNLGAGPDDIGALRQEVLNGTGRFDLPSVRVFPKDAEGNVAPVRVIQGLKTQLNWPTAISLDVERGEIYVANDTGQSITVYSATATGDVAPLRVLKGPRTDLKNPHSVFVDTVNDELWVANFGDHSATVYPRTASGDVAPLRTIRSAPRNSPATFLNNPFAIDYDSRRQEVLVPNCVQHPRLASFSVMADKAALPTRTIEGQNTKLNRTVHSIGYDEVHDEIVVDSNIGQAILTFRGDAKGDEAPIRVIQGPKTQLRDPEKIAVDGVNNEIFVLNMTIDDEVLVFDRLAQGDVAPKRILKGPDTQLGARELAVDPVNNLLIVTGNGILMFDRAASGNTKPLRIIRGPKSNARGGGATRVYPQAGRIIMNVGASGNGRTAFTGVWSITDSGDVPPRWTVGKGLLQNVRGVAVDPRNKTLIVSDKMLAAVLTFSVPEMFEPRDIRTAAR